MSLKTVKSLSKCAIETNCVLVSWELTNPKESFSKLVSIAECIPRTYVLEKSEIYWHGVCKSLIFRFPDDLEILNHSPDYSSKGIIQARSSSRFGVSDLGVNKRRINYLYKLLTK